MEETKYYVVDATDNIVYEGNYSDCKSFIIDNDGCFDDELALISELDLPIHGNINEAISTLRQIYLNENNYEESDVFPF